MNKKLFRNISTHSQSKAIALIICAAFFSGGCIAGAFFSAGIDSSNSVVPYIFGMLDTVGSSCASEGYGALLLSTIKFHVLAFAFGFSLLGIITVPLLSALKGFLAAFSVSIIIRTLGAESIWFAAALIGLDLLVTIPCFIALSIQSLCASVKLSYISLRADTQFGSGIYNSQYFKRFFFCCAVLLIWVFVKKYFVGQLIVVAALHI